MFTPPHRKPFFEQLWRRTKHMDTCTTATMRNALSLCLLLLLKETAGYASGASPGVW